jgi:hypothetical protein
MALDTFAMKMARQCQNLALTGLVQAFEPLQYQLATYLHGRAASQGRRYLKRKFMIMVIVSGCQGVRERVRARESACMPMFADEYPIMRVQGFCHKTEHEVPQNFCGTSCSSNSCNEAPHCRSHCRSYSGWWWWCRHSISTGSPPFHTVDHDPSI